jgi:hypothetical protein
MNVIDSNERSMLFCRKVVSTFRQHALTTEAPDLPGSMLPDV